MTTETAVPNTVDGAATQHNSTQGLDAIIATKMTAMRQQAERNRLDATSPVEPGASAAASTDSPVAPEALANEPEIDTDQEPVDTGTEEDRTQETVSESETADSNAQEIIDFLEFAETNPNAKFKFMRNGKEVVMDAKKAAAILGQGGAIHEEARELKIQKSEFQEYEREQREKLGGLTLAMEFTIQPQLQGAYDEILRVQGYQSTFHQQLSTESDPAQQARIRAGMQQNENYIQQQSDLIRQLQPKIEKFQAARKQQVQTVLEGNRKAFKDRELRNEYVYNEIREKVSKDWASARQQLVPGVDNIDLIASDEHILSLIRDGLKFRDRPAGKSAGASIAQLQARKGTTGTKNDSQDLVNLREKAKGRGKEATQAADNLLVAQLNKLRSARR
jgi:hypothetical protein